MTAQAALNFDPRSAPASDYGWSGLRDYQRAAALAGIAKLREERSTLVVLPTGCGKTRLAAHLVARRKRGKALWLAHRGELIDQGRNALEALTGERTGLEQAAFHADLGDGIVVATVQSLMRTERLTRFPRDHFSLIVCDEAHHFPSASFKHVLDHFELAKVFGMTAWPKRHDRKAMDTVFASEAYSYWIWDAIPDGWLVEPDPERIEIAGWHLRARRGDYTDTELEQTLHGNGIVECIAQQLVERAGDLRTACFSPGVESAEALAASLNALKPNSARAISGATDKLIRREMLLSHRRGEYQFICNCDVLTEGYDDPGLQLLALCRPTKSTGRYVQTMGRGLRPMLPPMEATPEARRATIAASAKPKCKILDFCGICEEHQISTVDAYDILGGKYDDETKQRARKDRADGEAVDAALVRAKKAIEAEKLEAARKAYELQAEVTSRKLDAFGTLHLERPQNDSGEKATPDQIAKLIDWHFHEDELPQGLTKAEAAKLLKTEYVRWKKGLAPFWMLRYLARHGVAVLNISKARARALREAIQANGGRITETQQHAIMGQRS